VLGVCYNIHCVDKLSNLVTHLISWFDTEFPMKLGRSSIVTFSSTKQAATLYQIQSDLPRNKACDVIGLLYSPTKCIQFVCGVLREIQSSNQRSIRNATSQCWVLLNGTSINSTYKTHLLECVSRQNVVVRLDTEFLK